MLFTCSSNFGETRTQYQIIQIQKMYVLVVNRQDRVNTNQMFSLTTSEYAFEELENWKTSNF